MYKTKEKICYIWEDVLEYHPNKSKIHFESIIIWSNLVNYHGEVSTATTGTAPTKISISINTSMYNSLYFVPALKHSTQSEIWRDLITRE